MSPNAEILIVEDSPTQAERLRSLLEARGYEVRVAADGEEALAALRERVPALVVTDIVMPGIDGYTLCEGIKSDQKLRDVPVILLTSLSEPHDVIRSLQCGADNFIRKPYDERSFLSRIGNILTSRELRESGRLQMGVEVYLAGDKHFITAERQQILDFLLSTYEEVVQINDELSTKSRRLREVNEELELRAAEVDAKNGELEVRQAELEQTLRELDVEKERAEQLANVNKAVLDATVDGISLVDLEGRTLLTNRAIERITSEVFGLSGEQTLYERSAAIAHRLTDPEGFLAASEAMAADHTWTAVDEFQLSDSGRTFQRYSAPVRGLDGDLVGRIVVLREVTEQRQAERLKSELVATVSHELRTPLTAVLGFAELLGQQQFDPETQKRYLGLIHNEAHRLTELINDFLDLHRIEEGSFALAPFDLAAVLRQQAELFAGQSKRHRLEADLPQEELEVFGERDRITQVVANLLSNAIKYSPKGGPVKLAAAYTNGDVRVAVTDSGIGIPRDQQPQIFTKFFRVHSSDTQEIGGTGLGLALCQEIVEAHGGQIGFHSIEGDGSTFWFRLPVNRGLLATMKEVQPETHTSLPQT